MFFCIQYVIGAIFRDIHIWSVTGDTGHYSVTSSNGSGSGQALATLPTSVGIVTDFFVGLDDQVCQLELTFHHRCGL